MPLFVSFIIPAHNEAALIERTLNTLRASAFQANLPHEIIVVNDASTDATAALARPLADQVIDVHIRQIGGARNAGTKTARGDVFVFVDADTLVQSATLDGMVRALERGAIAGGARVQFEGFVPFWGRAAAFFFLTIYFARKLAAGCFLFVRRDAFEKVGGFDERFYASEEVELSCSLQKIGRMEIVPHPVITSSRKFRTQSLQGYVRLIKRAIRHGKKTWQQREGLDIWYDGKRE